MVFGYSTNAFTQYGLSESLERIAALGFAGVEIMCDRPHLYPPDYDQASIVEVKNMFNAHHLKVTNLNSFTLFAVGDTYLPSWIEPEPDRRQVRIQHTRQCLEIAKTLKCQNISVPPGGPLTGGTRKEAMSRFHKGIETVAPLAEELGVKLFRKRSDGFYALMKTAY